ncbi:glutamine transport system permease protein [Paracoccus aminovorans]|uniref:Glutamine transport system permease protein n=1 Tax=Paracoccus aminovorans TaxID=34004 RepID=A0A1I3APM7_9RHOB|nr:glutamine ABC transporter permease GlnP [Paracoccus aminovorans]CQR84295.1 Glutamine transport system permease protein glnP [Paracoccus aminovorans]SFH51669.1 glutamine transport system permease protein [Paracoccus aminovorans]
MEIDWSVIPSFLPQLVAGAKVTLMIAFWGLVIGTTLGFLVGLMRAYGNRFVNALALIYVELIRGTPIVVQVMFLYFALPILTGIRINPMAAAILSIGVNAGAYIAEIVRGALLSIPKGLSEAGLAMGLPRWKVLVHIVGPLAFRRLIPPLGNQYIVSLKDTSLFIVIGVAELTRTGQEIMASNFRAVEIWTAVGVFYLIMTGVLSLVLRIIEKRMRIL